MATSQTRHPSTSQVVDLAAIVDEGRMNGFRCYVMFLILLAMFADGYDTVSISYAAPLITAAWQLDKGAMGSVFSAGLLGLIVGGAVIGTLGDWIGRRRAILISTVLLGVFSLGTVLATDLRSLLVWRFLTGLGIGSIAPLCAVLISEYAPRRSRTTLTVMIFLSLSVVGTAACGWISVELVPLYGWHSLFYFGGLLPLAVAVLLYLSLPESPKFLYVKQRGSPRLLTILRRLDPTLRVTDQTPLTWSGEAQEKGGVPYRMIFADGRVRVTLFLWLALFVGQFLAIGFTLWLPSLLSGFGFSPTRTALTILVTAVSGCLGGIAVTRLVDRFGVIALSTLPFLGALTVLAVSVLPIAAHNLFVAVVVAGFSIQGTLQGIMAIAPLLYPTAIRSAGVGLAVFLSRFGSILGPLLLGFVLARKASLQQVFGSFAAPLLVISITALCLGRLAQAKCLTGEQAELSSARR